MESSTATAIDSPAEAYGDAAASLGWRAALATALSLTSLAMIVGMMSFGISGDLQDIAFGVALTLTVGFSTVFSWLIIRARPNNAVGWLLLFQSLVTASMGFSDTYAEWLVVGNAHPSLYDRYVAAYSNGCWPLLFAGFAAIAFVFPDGRFFNERYRRWGWFYGISTAIVLIGVNFGSEKFAEPLDKVVSPLPALPGFAEAVTFFFIPGMLVGLGAAAFAVRARLKASTGDLRLQVLWLAYAAIWIPLTLALCFVDGAIYGSAGGFFTVIGLVVMGTMMPLAIAIGILRYRLFDIELVINRTLVYAGLTACVAIVYVAIASGLGTLIGNHGVAGLIGVGFVVVIIQPVHRRIQNRVDRWIYGDRANPYAALQRLDARLSETITPGEVVQAVVDSVAEALKLPYSAVEFVRGDETQVIASHGIVGRGSIERRELSYRGERVGLLAVEVPPGRTLADADEKLLDDLASHVGVAVESVSLAADLQQSRKDIVTTREEERRRLRRDLHDGVGPTLAAMSLKLEVLRDKVADGDRAVVDQLGEEVQEAITDIRRLVYALRPPALDEYGLVPALTEQAARMSSPSAEFAVRGPDEMPTLPAAAEVATYRIALEAMTNVSRHSGATKCDVELSLNGGLCLKISDNGDGFPPGSRRGVGLSSMRERADELGGTLRVESSDGGGTTVTALLPIEAA
jgi:signal transduction histidine kinase